MTTMLNKVAVAGDITQAIDRRGVWACAITVIGGASNTAVKVQSADSADGEFSDFVTLISADDASADQYKGFVLDLYGAKAFIKVTGATMATAVFGDCDHDVKSISIKAGEVPSGADLENNKTATIDVSTYTEPVEIEPTEGKDGMKKATVTLSNIPSAKEEQTKSVTITANGTTTVEPDEGKVLSSVSVTANVPARCVLRCYKMTTGTPITSYPEYIYLAKAYGSGSLDGEDYYYGTPLQSYAFSDTESYSTIDDTIYSSWDNFIYTRYSTGDITVTATN